MNHGGGANNQRIETLRIGMAALRFLYDVHAASLGGNGHLLQEQSTPFRMLIWVWDNFTGQDKGHVCCFAVEDDQATEQLGQRLKEVCR